MRAAPVASVLKVLVPALAALALAACGGAEEERTLTTDAEDVGGGEFIVTEEEPDAIPVDVPEVPMTPAPEADAAATEPVPE